MGRGRAKAKQTRVARELKYSSPNTDLSALQKELAGSHVVLRRPTRATTDDDEDDDEYGDRWADDDADDDWAASPRDAVLSPLADRGHRSRRAAVSVVQPAGPPAGGASSAVGADQAGPHRRRRSAPDACPRPTPARRGARAAPPPVGVVRGDRRDHADAAVERPLGLRRAARRAPPAAGRPPAAPRCCGRAPPSSPSGTTRAVLPASPPPVMWAKACTRVDAELVDQGQAVAGVDAGGLEQLLAQRPVQPGRGARSRSSAGGGHHPAHQRVAVGVEPGRRHGDHRRRRRAPARARGRRRPRPRRPPSRRGRTRRRPSGRRARRSRRRPGPRRPGCSRRRCR